MLTVCDRVRMAVLDVKLVLVVMLAVICGFSDGANKKPNIIIFYVDDVRINFTWLARSSSSLSLSL